MSQNAPGRKNTDQLVLLQKFLPLLDISHLDGSLVQLENAPPFPVKQVEPTDVDTEMAHKFETGAADFS
jgi:hypothetical protein